jgi:uncharacterized membrane protein
METAILLLRVVHVIGHILWLGGAVTICFFASHVLEMQPDAKRKALSSLRALALRIVTPGMLLAFGAGLTMLILGWSELYAKQPWMHTKLTLGILAAALTGILTGRLRKHIAGLRETRPVFYRILGWLFVAIAVANALLVYLRPGAR